MQKYQDRTRSSGVRTFEIGENSITIQFKTGDTYVYDDERPGKLAIEYMKELALRGKGLST